MKRLSSYYCFALPSHESFCHSHLAINIFTTIPETKEKKNSINTTTIEFTKVSFIIHQQTRLAYKRNIKASSSNNNKKSPDDVRHAEFNL